jgi:hypothetical protein
MGADEIDQSKTDSVSYFGPEVLEKLDGGWRISSLPDGQLLLLPPSTHRELDQK